MTSLPPKTQKEIFNKRIWSWEEPPKPIAQVQEWWSVTVPHCRAVGSITDLFAASFSIWLGLVQPADPSSMLEWCL